jgi:hypothetical protein
MGRKDKVKWDVWKKKRKKDKGRRKNEKREETKQLY